MSNLYERIEELCKLKGQSITTMCKESGASRASLSDLKMGRNQKLSAGTLSKIAQYFDVSIDYLLTGQPTYRVQNPDGEDNPWEIELLDSFDGLSLGDQIETVAQVQALAHRSENKKAPAENGKRSVSDDDIKFALFGGDGEITDAMYDEVKRFAAYIKQREADKK